MPPDYDTREHDGNTDYDDEDRQAFAAEKNAIAKHRPSEY